MLCIHVLVKRNVYLFNLKMFSNGSKMGLPKRSWGEKIIHTVGKHWKSTDGKEKVSDTAVKNEKTQYF